MQESVKPLTFSMSPNGRYDTSLFTGAATYSYPIDVPPGTNGLTPSVVLTYNSHDALNHNSWVGAGWSLNLNYAKRDINHQVDPPVNRDKNDVWNLVLNGQYVTFYRNVSENKFHTEEESYLDIQRKTTTNNNGSQYYLITTKDGTKYSFGDSFDSEAFSTTGTYTGLYYYLTKALDTHGNTVYYTYVENAGAGDSTATYLSKIEYNNDKSRRIEFILENSLKTIPTPVYDQGSKISYMMQLKEIRVYANNNLVSVYKFSYALNEAGTLLLLKKIQKYGSDGTTSLPPVTFEYEQATPGWTNAPQWETDYGIGGSQGNVISDVNNDGWTDVLRSDKNYNSNGQTTYFDMAYMNTGSQFAGNDTLDDLWHPPQPFAYEIVSTHTFSDEYQLFDANGDGYPDLISSAAAYLNKKAGWNTGSSSQWRAPLDIEGKDGVVVSDVNNDGLADIMKSYRSSSVPLTSDTWLNNGNGWTLDSGGTWKPPREFIWGTSSGGIQTKAQITDVNGDGLPDIVSATDCYINTGNGWVSDSAWVSPVSLLGTNGIRIRDVNNDGLADILQGRGYTDSSHNENYVYAAWLNTGHGWASNASWAPPDHFVYRFYDESVGEELAAADVNGDGQLDFIDADDSWIHKGTSYSNRLVKISDEFGGKTTIQYAPTTAFPRSGLGIVMQVVKNITRENGMSSTPHNIISQTSYSYEGGLYNYTEQEFMGFAHVTLTDALNQRHEHYFHQNKELKGKEYRYEVYSVSGNPFRKDEQVWTYRTMQKSTQPLAYNYRVWLNETKEFLYDGLVSNPKITNVTNSFDTYGNLIRQKYGGDLSVTGDEKFIYNEYVYNTTAWILNRVKHTFQLDADNINKVREAWFSYDGHSSPDDPPIIGDKTREESWLSGGTNPVTVYTNDAFGNVVTVTDPKGNTTTYRYGITDPTFTFREQVVNPLGHMVQYRFDPGTGNILRITDPNGYITTYEYDTFGRQIKEIKPYDSSMYPTKTFEYYIDGNSPEYIKTSVREQAGTIGTIDGYEFYDGFGQKIQTRAESETPSQTIVISIFYDTLGRAFKQTIPYYDSGNSYSPPPANRVTINQFDTLNRIIRITNPDDTVRTFTFDHWVQQLTDENGNIIRKTSDAFGRITKVEEINGTATYTTVYTYSPRDELKKIVDHEGNVFSYTYDTLGRKTQDSDPDRGTWLFTYDANGNLISQTDARGRTTTYTYDSLNRQTLTNYPTDTDISNIYDETVKGTLSRVVRGTDTVSYTYDNRLRKTQETKVMDGNTWTTQLQYDDLDRVKSVTYPTGEVVQNSYNSRGLLSSVTGVLSTINYNELGKITKKDYANGISAGLEYYPTDYRLKRILITGKQDLSYAYDNVGNVKSINDQIKGLSQSFTYDSLNRLTSADQSGGYGLIHYNYSPIGNLVQKIVNGIGTAFTYGEGSAGPHALTKQSSSLKPLPGYTNLPTDPDGDGIYEDLNANGRLDFADVVLYFNQMTWIAANEPIAAFDLNGNGRIDFADIVALFNEI